MRGGATGPDADPSSALGMSRARFGLLLALVAVVVAAGAFAIGVAALDDDGPDTPPGGGPDAVATTSTTAPPGDAETEDTAAAGEPTWIAVVASGASEDEARTHADRAAAAGLPAGVLRSDDHESLAPGFWVAYAGPYATPGEADGAVAALTAAGIEGTYSRCVGTDEQCGDG